MKKRIKAWVIMQKPTKNRKWSLCPTQNPAIYTNFGLAMKKWKEDKRVFPNHKLSEAIIEFYND